MRAFDQRAGGVRHLEPGGLPRASAFVGGPVRGDEHAARRRAGQFVELATMNAVRVEPCERKRVMDEIAEGGQRTLGGEAFGVAQGVAHAEAEAVVFGQENFHWKRWG